MGGLPALRDLTSHPLSRTEVDYAGPFMCKESHRRNIKLFKVYIALFTCFSMWAIHIELVSVFSTLIFMAALKRYISRRGKPVKLISDCATSFRGASRELKKLYNMMSSISKDQQVHICVKDEGITWSFNPPSSPHFGGLWEANIKSMKYHLRQIIGSSVFTLKEIYTFFSQVKECLNSRALFPLSNDSNHLQVL